MKFLLIFSSAGFLALFLLGATFAFFPLEKYGKYFFPHIIWWVENSENMVALTFDDGPSPQFTPKLLEILDEFEVKATFFVIGTHAEKNPGLIKLIHRKGHEIESHSYSHHLLWFKSEDFITAEIDKNERILQQIVGIKPKFFRPPMGLWSSKLLKKLESRGYKAVIGDVYPRDPWNPGAERIFKRVISLVESGSIIILHDGSARSRGDRTQTLQAVPEIIRVLKKRGFKFVTLSRLVESRAN